MIPVLSRRVPATRKALGPLAPSSVSKRNSKHFSTSWKRAKATWRSCRRSWRQEGPTGWPRQRWKRKDYNGGQHISLGFDSQPYNTPLANAWGAWQLQSEPPLRATTFEWDSLARYVIVQQTCGFWPLLAALSVLFIYILGANTQHTHTLQ